MEMLDIIQKSKPPRREHIKNMKIKEMPKNCLKCLNETDPDFLKNYGSQYYTPVKIHFEKKYIIEGNKNAGHIYHILENVQYFILKGVDKDIASRF